MEQGTERVPKRVRAPQPEIEHCFEVITKYPTYNTTKELAEVREPLDQKDVPRCKRIPALVEKKGMQTSPSVKTPWQGYLDLALENGELSLFFAQQVQNLHKHLAWQGDIGADGNRI